MRKCDGNSYLIAVFLFRSCYSVSEELVFEGGIACRDGLGELLGELHDGGVHSAGFRPLLADEELPLDAIEHVVGAFHSVAHGVGPYRFQFLRLLGGDGERVGLHGGSLVVVDHLRGFPDAALCLFVNELFGLGVEAQCRLQAVGRGDDHAELGSAYYQQAEHLVVEQKETGAAIAHLKGFFVDTDEFLLCRHRERYEGQQDDKDGLSCHFSVVV